jgi:hypothetical protein
MNLENYEELFNERFIKELHQMCGDANFIKTLNRMISEGKLLVTVDRLDDKESNACFLRLPILRPSWVSALGSSGNIAEYWWNIQDD